MLTTDDWQDLYKNIEIVKERLDTGCVYTVGKIENLYLTDIEKLIAECTRLNFEIAKLDKGFR